MRYPILPQVTLERSADRPPLARHQDRYVEVEHPPGFFTVTPEVKASGGAFTVTRSALLRTARLLMRGEVLVPSSVWNQGAPL